jgi:cob(I)alamin adenosyltransferase
MPITKLDQISTKNGDKGFSKNFVNDVFQKDDALFEVLGTMDELSSFIGLSYQYNKNEFLKVIQKTLQTINSLIATPPTHPLYKKLLPITKTDIESLESSMQELLIKNPVEPHFYLPGSETTLAGAYLDVSRSISRRAERRMVHFIKHTNRDDLSLSLEYMNRLSDYLFVCVRAEK